MKTGLIVERDVLSHKAAAITPLAKKVAELGGVDTAGVGRHRRARQDRP